LADPVQYPDWLLCADNLYGSAREELSRVLAAYDSPLFEHKEEWDLKYGPGEIEYAVAWDSLTDEQKRFQATKMAIHAAMVDRTDRELGRLLDQLESMNALDDTLILFLSDIGPCASATGNWSTSHS
jgi:arylsulfatase A-like enzyme